MKKINLKPGDIVEIIDIHPKDSRYNIKEKFINKRGIVETTAELNREYIPNYIGPNMQIDGLYCYFYAIKVKKVRVLNPKNKKK
jgi:hypothetical protein